MNLDEGKKIFREEAKERLAEIEEAMLELEERPNDSELVSRTFRAMHTIKGSGAMFEFTDIVEFTHDIESVYDLVRDGTIAVTKELISLTLSAHDEILGLLNHPEKGEEGRERRRKISESFRSLIPGEQGTGESEPKNDKMDLPEQEKSGSKVFRIRFSPAEEIYATGSKPILLLDELRELGDCEIIAQTDRIPDLSVLDPERLYLYWDILLRTDQGKNAIRDVFIFVEDDCEITIGEITEEEGESTSLRENRLGEILIERGLLKQDELKKVLKKQLPVGELLVKEGLTKSDNVKSALAEQQFVRKLKDREKRTETASNIRVSSDKLDKLVDLVGELVTGQARLSQISGQLGNSDLTTVAEEIERLTAELRDNTMSVRMLTLANTFGKFKRLVRDLGNELQKELTLVTEGADTELDKTVIEQLNDPLVHIIRNSVDHGIEPPDVRAGLGKPTVGTIHLSASYSGAHVVIEIRDDGSGMNPETIRKKAVERGLISSDTKSTDKEIFQLVFQPGFSTATKVTNVSGRGVGMDVVKKGIESLRGTVEIDSEWGKGTKLTLKLPLTLAIIDGLLVKVGPEFFILPLAAIEECIELTDRDIRDFHGRHVVNVRGRIVPYIRLRDRFRINGKRRKLEQVVITEIGEQRIGFVVDSVIGQHQTVIKTLSKVYKNVEGISGATIMADGTVSLIVDINNLLRSVESQDRQATGGQ